MARHKKPEPEIIHQVQGQGPDVRQRLIDEGLLTPARVQAFADILEKKADADLRGIDEVAQTAQTIIIEGVKLSTFTQKSLAERVEEARARVDRAETIADATYWQGALDALEAFSSGTDMPEIIGAGVKKSA